MFLDKTCMHYVIPYCYAYFLDCRHSQNAPLWMYMNPWSTKAGRNLKDWKLSLKES